jgi:outer membrane protein
MNAKFSILISAALITLRTVSAAPQDTLRLSLRQVMDTARSAAVSVQLARSHSAEMEASVGEARGALLPHLGASATDGIRSEDLPAQGLSAAAFGFTGPNAPVIPNLIPPFNYQDARVNASISLVDISAWKRYEASLRENEGSQWDEQAASEDAVMAAAAAYLDLARARALISARDSELVIAQQLDTLTLAQKQAGSLTRIEVLRAQGQLSSAQSARAAASGQEEQARFALLRILGLNMATYPELTDTLSLEGGNAEVSDSSSVDAAVSSRPEVLSADKQAEAARENLGALKAGYLPTLNVGGDYGLSGRRLDGNAEWTEDLVVQLNWSLWDGGTRDAKQSEQHERLRQAEIRQHDTRDAVEQDFRTSASSMRATREQATHALDQVRFAEEEARLAQERFAAGGSGNLEVITAQNSLSLAHDGYIDALYGYNRARLAFLRAAHRLSEF